MTTKAGDEKAPVVLDDAAILAKAKTGEKLTPEEEEHVAGNPNLERSPERAPAEEGEEIEEEAGEESGAEASAPPTEGAEGEEAPEGAGAPKKPTEQGPAAKQTPEQIEERKKLVNAELDKPDAQVDLSKFTPVEIGLYWDLKKQRRKNQKLESDNRLLQFREMKRTLEEEEAPAAEEEGEEGADPTKIFEGREDDDLPTIGELRQLFGKKKPKAAAKAKEGEEGAGKPKAPIITADRIRVEKVEADARLKSKGVNDFFDVVDYAEFALANDPDAQDELRETARTGGNVAEKTYWLVKGSQAWPKIDEAIKKEKGGKGKGGPAPENVERGKRIEHNAGKVKTTGGGGGAGAATGEYTLDEIKSMSPKDFGKLPKKTQDAILWKFGSEPNLDR